MTYEDKILKILEENNGHISRKTIVDMGIPTIYLTRLVNQGRIERVDRGIYIMLTISKMNYIYWV